MTVLHLFPAGRVEVGCSDRGRPSYRWESAYSQAVSPGVVSQPLTLANWRGMAKRDGQRIRIHESPDAALLAVEAEIK